MHKVYRILTFFGLTTVHLHLPADQSIQSLEKHGTFLRLSGNFTEAKVVETKLIDLYTQPAGHVFALNSIITQLTWDETETKYDDALTYHATKTLEWCESKTNHKSLATIANYYCGQANFVLSYYHALRGNYFQAGRRGTAGIEYLETTLLLDPSLVDAKMHLGIGYYVADNLPPFIKIFSRLLWFIPTGNSQKSLPYLKDVMNDGDKYKDVARYLYSTLIIQTPELKAEATSQLKNLVALYPTNARFQLRLMSLLISRKKFEECLITIADYLRKSSDLKKSDLGLTKIWKARAHLGLGELELAKKTLSEIHDVFIAQREELPNWGVAWYMLTKGQLNDLGNNRKMALKNYKELLVFAEDTYLSGHVVNSARKGLSQPYQIISEE